MSPPGTRGRTPHDRRIASHAAHAVAPYLDNIQPVAGGSRGLDRAPGWDVHCAEETAIGNTVNLPTARSVRQGKVELHPEVPRVVQHGELVGVPRFGERYALDEPVVELLELRLLVRCQSAAVKLGPKPGTDRVHPSGLRVRRDRAGLDPQVETAVCEQTAPRPVAIDSAGTGVPH
jgi:hypothetical protein